MQCLKDLQSSQENTSGVSFYKAGGLRACNCIRKRLLQRCFPVNFGKFCGNIRQRLLLTSSSWTRSETRHLIYCQYFPSLGFFCLSLLCWNIPSFLNTWLCYLLIFYQIQLIMFSFNLKSFPITVILFILLHPRMTYNQLIRSTATKVVLISFSFFCKHSRNLSCRDFHEFAISINK